MNRQSTSSTAQLRDRLPTRPTIKLQGKPTRLTSSVSSIFQQLFQINHQINVKRHRHPQKLTFSLFPYALLCFDRLFLTGPSVSQILLKGRSRMLSVLWAFGLPGRPITLRIETDIHPGHTQRCWYQLRTTVHKYVDKRSFYTKSMVDMNFLSVGFNGDEMT